MTKSLQSEPEKIIIGKVGAPHGIRGELKIYSLSDFPDRFSLLKSVYVGDDLLTVKSVRYQNSVVLMSFAEYDNRETAATLTNKMLSVKREYAMPLEEGQYYIGDIVGLEVFDEEGVSLGFVKDILKTGSNDVYVVAKKKEAKQLLVPALKSVVLKISVDEGKMLVRLPEEI